MPVLNVVGHKCEHWITVLQGMWENPPDRTPLAQLVNPSCGYVQPYNLLDILRQYIIYPWHLYIRAWVILPAHSKFFTPSFKL